MFLGAYSGQERFTTVKIGGIVIESEAECPSPYTVSFGHSTGGEGGQATRRRSSSPATDHQVGH